MQQFTRLIRARDVGVASISKLSKVQFIDLSCKGLTRAPHRVTVTRTRNLLTIRYAWDSNQRELTHPLNRGNSSLDILYDMNIIQSRGFNLLIQCELL
ncbi:hypothetical protein Bpfe_028688, partial [Biomphalaria pfeifferi]